MSKNRNHLIISTLLAVLPLCTSLPAFAEIIVPVNGYEGDLEKVLQEYGDKNIWPRSIFSVGLLNNFKDKSPDFFEIKNLVKNKDGEEEFALGIDSFKEAINIADRKKLSNPKDTKVGFKAYKDKMFTESDDNENNGIFSDSLPQANSKYEVDQGQIDKMTDKATITKTIIVGKNGVDIKTVDNGSDLDSEEKDREDLSSTVVDSLTSEDPSDVVYLIKNPNAGPIGLEEVKKIVEEYKEVNKPVTVESFRCCIDSFKDWEESKKMLSEIFGNSYEGKREVYMDDQIFFEWCIIVPQEKWDGFVPKEREKPKKKNVEQETSVCQSSEEEEGEDSDVQENVNEEKGDGNSDDSTDDGEFGSDFSSFEGETEQEQEQQEQPSEGGVISWFKSFFVDKGDN